MDFNINSILLIHKDSCCLSANYSCGNRLRPALYCAEVLLAKMGEK